MSDRKEDPVESLKERVRKLEACLMSALPYMGHLIPHDVLEDMAKSLSRPGMSDPKRATKVRFAEHELTMSERLTAALTEVMRAECEMMAESPGTDEGDWTMGRCYVGNLDSTWAYSFEYGGKSDDPFDDGLGDFAVVVLKAGDHE